MDLQQNGYLHKLFNTTIYFSINDLLLNEKIYKLNKAMFLT